MSKKKKRKVGQNTSNSTAKYKGASGAIALSRPLRAPRENLKTSPIFFFLHAFTGRNRVVVSGRRGVCGAQVHGRPNGAQLEPR